MNTLTAERKTAEGARVDYIVIHLTKYCNLATDDVMYCTTRTMIALIIFSKCQITCCETISEARQEESLKLFNGRLAINSLDWLYVDSCAVVASGFA